ncbi:50S ribosomal protein L1-like [Oppia nitens]|uniref:50S ribosomal protein L1-like n=1 Tax=Oppia nitens TaxID=1686743 RepID=UPI0023DBC58D|nr:50S ribosomal protein L1-like [Oppia nitens]
MIYLTTICGKYFGVNAFQLYLSPILTTKAKTTTLSAIAINCIQSRGMAARRGKRIAANREKQRLARIKREEAKNAPPKVWSPEKLKIDKSALNVGPRRFSDKHLKDLTSIVDNVYVTSLYKQLTYSMTDAIEMYRETHDETGYNETNSMLETTVELDLRTKKKTKFCDAFKGIVSYPNKFEYKANRRIIAICKKDEDKFDAKEAGADVVGGQEIIKMLKKGDLSLSNFDDLVCHGDLLIELADIRGILGSAFPSKLRGNLGFDMKKLVNQFVNGIEYKCTKDEFELDYGWVRVPFGRLNQSNVQLEQNIRHLLSTIEKHKPTTAIVPFITRVLIHSEPSNEEFAVKFWNYIEGYEESDPDNENNVDNDKESLKSNA